MDIVGWTKYSIQIQFHLLLYVFNMATRNFKIKYVSYIIFLLDWATLELVFLHRTFLMRFSHGGIGSSIHCVLYSTLFFHTVVGRQNFFLVINSAVCVSKNSLRVQLSSKDRKNYFLNWLCPSHSYQKYRTIFMLLIRGQQTASVKAQIVNILGFSTKW